MGWLEAGIDAPVVAVRAIHFAATATTTGVLVFRAAVVSSSPAAAAAIVRAQTLLVGWIGLALSALSGVIWLLVLAVSLSGMPFEETVASGVLLDVVNVTQFGLIAEIRLALAVMVAVCLAFDRFVPARRLAAGLSLALIAAMAWTGHAGSTAGDLGILHLTADILHLFAAAIWTGGLLSLVLVLAVSRRDQTEAGASLARDATQFFSTMGIGIVVVILATGIVDAWILVGTWQALIATPYGQLLMLKVALVTGMLLIAAVNRFWLTPRLALPIGGMPQPEALRLLARNSMVEIVLALMIFAIVGVLGTLHPMIHAS